MTSHFKIDQGATNRLLRDDAVAAFLDLEDHEVISNLAPRHLYPSGIELFKQGFASEGVYWIETGLVKLVHLNHEGRESIVGLRSRGCILGAVAVIVRRPSLVSAVTVTQCHLRRVPAAALLSLTRNNPKFSWHLHQQHAQEIYDQVAQLVRLGSFSARQRLEQLLLQLISILELGEFEKRTRLRLPLKYYEIAQLIVITPQHLSRLLKQMQQEGIIRREKGAVIICDPQRLRCLPDL